MKLLSVIILRDNSIFPDRIRPSVDYSDSEKIQLFEPKNRNELLKIQKTIKTKYVVFVRKSSMINPFANFDLLANNADSLIFTSYLYDSQIYTESEIRNFINIKNTNSFESLIKTQHDILDLMVLPSIIIPGSLFSKINVSNISIKYELFEKELALLLLELSPTICVLKEPFIVTSASVPINKGDCVEVLSFSNNNKFVSPLCLQYCNRLTESCNINNNIKHKIKTIIKQTIKRIF